MIRGVVLIGLWLAIGTQVAIGLWLLLHAPRPIAWEAPRPARRPRSPGIQRSWLALTGLPLTPAGVQRIGWLTGAGTAVSVSLGTRNVFVGAAFGWMGLWAPEALIRYRARKQWQRLDVAAYAAAHMLHAKLQSGMPVLEAVRALLADAAEPFRSWVAPCLAAEAQGVPLERALKSRAAPIQHVELGVLADVLSAEREHGLTAPVLARAVDLWSQRIHADAVRRGTLAGSTMLGYGVVLGGVAAFWLTVWWSAAVRQGLDHGVGFVVTGIGAWLIAIAGWLQNRVSRQAEAV